MIRAVAACLLIACAQGAGAQEDAAPGRGAVLRGLDKITTELRDLDLANGEAAELGSLTVELTECRYPEGNPAGDAYAHVTIRETNGGKLWFNGWMLASSPALNALEHPRYDVWVMRCTT
ncbi:MAG: DUF2155 domain-containing protein [Roseovarius sp.]|uniref:DUF2155 domain-containing protein n=1 Tax=Roseovarius sp. TaxID=1486281 RepID=UPI004057DF54